MRSKIGGCGDRPSCGQGKKPSTPPLHSIPPYPTPLHPTLPHSTPAHPTPFHPRVLSPSGSRRYFCTFLQEYEKYWTPTNEYFKTTALVLIGLGTSLLPMIPCRARDDVNKKRIQRGTHEEFFFNVQSELQFHANPGSSCPWLVQVECGCSEKHKL